MIIFYFEFNGIGGVQVLFYNLIKELSKNGIETKLIHHEDGWLVKELFKSNININILDVNNLTNSNIRAFVKPKDIIVTTMFFINFYKFILVNPYIIFWNVFPSSLECSNKSPVFIKIILKKWLIKLMLNKKGLLFMDYTGVEFVNSKYNIFFDPLYLGIPIDGQIENEYLEKLKSLNRNKIEGLRITYIGRAVNWKIFPVIKILDDIFHSMYVKEIEINIITDNVEEFEKQIGDYKRNIRIVYHQNITGDSLGKFLLEKSDLHIGMGTSALEGASLGIPTITVDACYTVLPADYKYRWIYESTKYPLGRIVGGDDYVNLGYSINSILDNYFEDNKQKIETISNQCWKYTQLNHDTQLIAKELINKSTNSKLKITHIHFFNLNLFKSLIKRLFGAL